MNILIVSQCSKKALLETRRILDQFAERKGERTWQTAITQQGLDTVRKLLRKTAKRNTAVACHWIKSANQTELLWLVGNVRHFNDQGTVPTNTTSRDILRSADENQWRTAEAISLLAGIAGLFHDFGKANRLFQEKLKPKSKLRSEPYRHEWVSLRLFQAFARNRTDQEWLEKLATINGDDEVHVLDGLIKDSGSTSPNPFKSMNGLAKMIGWLIVSHHRLPKYGKEEDGPNMSEMDLWMAGKMFGAHWNSPQCDYDDWTARERRDVWVFEHGTPIRSQTWRDKAHSLAKRALKLPQLCKTDWLQDSFSCHLARLTLMLADHCYSADNANKKWQDCSYEAYANTDRLTKDVKQKLDEHNVGVGHNAVLLAKNLPKLRQTLPAITRHKGFKQRSKDEKYRWQDKSYELAVGIRARTEEQGFFGVNVASTGCGKTFANARIMYGLADEKLGCRFNVALGLRTLTLQTGDALQARLQLESDDLAVLIGSQAVRQLHELQKAGKAEHRDKSTLDKLTAEQSGSESAQEIDFDNQYLRYDGSLDDGRLSHWLEKSPALHKLLSAPVVVSTIDHLMPATEGDRGGKQIAPMLRLLTSDLVLDEPDDFDLADLPALCRLVNWAGMLGSRVLLSSATLPPALIRALFDAYRSGRMVFNAACRDAAYSGVSTAICCAWFDEFGVKQSDHIALADFSVAHEQFVEKRIKKLSDQGIHLRRAELLPVISPTKAVHDVIDAMAQSIYQGIHRLHKEHHQVHLGSGKKVSIGLVRMANIKPMVAMSQRLLAQAPESDTRIHFCIYHSQHPLLVRSEMERALDAALTRHHPEKLWQVDAIANALTSYPEQNQLFIVFATSVAEVGRDHDYDWAIAEPSSMRSLIQLAGRVQRHRQMVPKTANLLILNSNFKALKGEDIAYSKPGFESRDFKLTSKELSQNLTLNQYQYISATPRIQLRNPCDGATNLVDLEHVHLNAKLFGGGKIAAFAALWWQRNPGWCAEFQRRTRFRQSGEDEPFVLYMEDEDDEPQFHLVAETGELAPVDLNRFIHMEYPFDPAVQPWVENNVKKLTEQLAEKMGLELGEVSRRFAELRLRKINDKWLYNPLFGVHGALE